MGRVGVGFALPYGKAPFGSLPPVVCVPIVRAPVGDVDRRDRILVSSDLRTPRRTLEDRA